jgi:hypothetical protein
MSLTKIALRRLDKEIAKAVGGKKVSLIRTSLFGTPAASGGGWRDEKINRLTNTMMEHKNIPKEQSGNYDKFLTHKYNSAKTALRKGSTSRVDKYSKPIKTRLKKFKIDKKYAKEDGEQFPPKRKDAPTWGDEVKGSGVGKDDKVIINHGGGKHYLEHMLKTKNKSMGYRLERGDEKGIQVHPMTKKYKNYAAQDKSRINYYSGRAEAYGDTPAKLTGQIKSKYLSAANNEYEAGIAAKNLKHLKNPRIKETNYSGGGTYVSGKQGKIDEAVLEKMKNNTFNGENPKKEVAKIKRKLRQSEKESSGKKVSNSQRELKKIKDKLNGASPRYMDAKSRYAYEKSLASEGNKDGPRMSNAQMRGLIKAESKKPNPIHSKIGEGNDSNIKERLAKVKEEKARKAKARELVERNNRKKHNKKLKDEYKNNHRHDKPEKEDISSIHKKINENANGGLRQRAKELKDEKDKSRALKRNIAIGGAATLATGGGIYHALKKDKDKQGLASA